jgi:hypothetical protein
MLTALSCWPQSAVLARGKFIPNRDTQYDRTSDTCISLRLDLTAANHVHIIEPHWNPMAEAQAIDRIYRIGQKREVFVTRYIVPKSIETVRLVL